MADSLSSLSRDIFSKTLLSENYSKNPSAAKKKQALEWGGLRFPSRVFDMIESRWSGN